MPGCRPQHGLAKMSSMSLREERVQAHGFAERRDGMQVRYFEAAVVSLRRPCDEGSRWCLTRSWPGAVLGPCSEGNTGVSGYREAGLCATHAISSSARNDTQRNSKIDAPVRKKCPPPRELWGGADSQRGGPAESSIWWIELQQGRVCGIRAAAGK